MRDAASNNTTMVVSGAAGLKNFRSPIPYLFGGLALMLAIIAVALLILACSYRKSYSSSSASAGDEEKPHKMVDMEVISEPKIVVIMAGESKPRYLAEPVSSSTSHTAQAV